MDMKFAIVLIVGLSAAGAFLINVTLGAIVRLRALRQAPPPNDIEARLARIEAAVEAIAIEMERSGELQRFTARLEGSHRLPEVQPVARPITPH
jgi:hypothetical protein